jgi:hypothetical protein
MLKKSTLAELKPQNAKNKKKDVCGNRRSFFLREWN